MKMEAKRARKPNFSSAECNLILQLAEENLAVIREKFSNTLTNKKKNEVWQSICDKVNAFGVAKRSVKDIKEKWRAMCGAARKDMAEEKKSQNKTGGGKAPTPPKETSQRIIELIGDEPGFSGIEGGIESGTSYATEPDFQEATTIELAIVPLVPAQHQEIEDPLLLGDDDDDDNDDGHTGGPAATAAPNTEPAAPPKPKKQKVTHQDIQAMQLEVLKVEKNKIDLEVENLKLANQKLRLDIEALEAKKHSVNIFN